jgi:RNA-dependent RNA polymerase
LEQQIFSWRYFHSDSTPRFTSHTGPVAAKLGHVAIVNIAYLPARVIHVNVTLKLLSFTRCKHCIARAADYTFFPPRPQHKSNLIFTTPVTTIAREIPKAAMEPYGTLMNSREHSSSPRTSNSSTSSTEQRASPRPRHVMQNTNKPAYTSPSRNPLTPRQQNISNNNNWRQNSRPPKGPDPFGPGMSRFSSSSENVRRDRQQAMYHREMQQHAHLEREPWKDWEKLSVILSGLPQNWGTREVHKLLLDRQASPVRIDMTYKAGNAKVIFRPPPRNASWWIRNGIRVTLASGEAVHILCKAERESDYHAKERMNGHFEEMGMNGSTLAIGVMTDRMLVMRTIRPVNQACPRLVVNVKKQQLDLHFSLRLGLDTNNGGQSFFFRIPFSEIRSVTEDKNPDGNTHFIISLETPPLAFRKVQSMGETHDDKVNVWDERQAWYRQTSIEADPRLASRRRTQLRNEESYIDIGRWLCYRFTCSSTFQPLAQQLRVVLAKHNITVRQQSVDCTAPGPLSQWHWLGSSHESDGRTATSSIDLFNSTIVHLPFTVQYQLEACISQGCLHESTLSTQWVEQLLAQDKGPNSDRYNPQYPRAARLLEKVLESKQRFYNPMDIFHFGQQISLARKHIPETCTMVRSATVTPTTIYFNTPSVDTSNRVIRKFSEHEDRFLRVKFRDESYKGTIMTFDDDTNDELFTRVNRVLKNGIVVGDRHHEFLAYGNSQFREHGAYFFAPTSTVTTDMMRSWMGDFRGIKTVAKYASRIGQCFTTTKAMNDSAEVQRIPDIERNGYCFTDGVGKISQFSLWMSTRKMNLRNCPSVIQFRLGGAKGVLACDPNLKGQVVQIRPSQEKFPARYKGLEICRVSQFTAAYLNQQIVLVLSALGVPDEVFMGMLRGMLSKLEVAMSDETVAKDLLLSNVDPNQSTVALAEMIDDGFMSVQDPFFVTNLRLWRAWSIKYLKEKAKILIEDGAFVIGNIDETGFLKGHSDLAPTSDMEHDESLLPEIFIQVEDCKNRGTWKIIKGVCGLGRNPSLHCGDYRVVKAVDVPALRHYRDCVVFPSKGDRDIPGMCSGGDLDGDDYFVTWDPNLIPKEWNHAPMDYSPPPPLVSDEPVTVDDMTAFFVTHMKYDNLGRIATAHRYWADKEEEGVKHENCLELAALHSRAVDYAKTGVAAEMPKHLKVQLPPHWSGKDKNYKSRKILGQMYDAVTTVDLESAWELSFDKRILEAFELDSCILALAREVKYEYDEAIRRLMKQHGVKTEFEIWTTFILGHNHESRDFKIAEELGETVAGLKTQFQNVCYERAGTTAQERDWGKIRLFVAAMYTVTAQEVAQANRECESRHLAAGRWVPDRERTPEAMPLMSFPWLFRRELGHIAMRRSQFDSVRSPTANNSTSFAPLGPVTPSISTSPGGTAQLPEHEPPAEVKEKDRKDSFELIPLEPIDAPIARNSPNGISDNQSFISSNGSALLDMHELSSSTPSLEVLEHVLSGSRAFDHSDRDDLSEGAAELLALSEEPSGQYESNVLDAPPLLGSPQTSECASDEEAGEVEVSEPAMVIRFSWNISLTILCNRSSLRLRSRLLWASWELGTVETANVQD